MKKSVKKVLVVVSEFAGQFLFTKAVGDLATALKERTDSQALRCLIDIGSGVVVGLHAASCGGRVESSLERIEAEPDPAPVAAEASPDPDDWTGDEAPFVEEE